MAKTRSTPPAETPGPPNLRIPRDEAEAKLAARVEQGTEVCQKFQSVVASMLPRSRFGDTSADASLTKMEESYWTWDKYNADLLRRIFTNESVAGEYSRGISIGFLGGPAPTPQERAREFVGKLDDKLGRLRSIRERLELMEAPPPIAAQAAAPPREASASTATARTAADTSTGRLVFISHSAEDVNLATALVNLLTAAIKPPLLKEEILCTSVPGCTLKGGDSTHERIKAEIKSVPVFIALITGLSVESTYVLFELGARWLAELHAIPLLGPGTDYGLLPGPWKGNLHALKTDTRAKVLQLVHEVAERLGRQTQPAHTWDAQVDDLLRAGK